MMAKHYKLTAAFLPLTIAALVAWGPAQTSPGEVLGDETSEARRLELIGREKQLLEEKIQRLGRLEQIIQRRQQLHPELQQLEGEFTTLAAEFPELLEDTAVVATAPAPAPAPLVSSPAPAPMVAADLGEYVEYAPSPAAPPATAAPYDTSAGTGSAEAWTQPTDYGYAGVEPELPVAGGGMPFADDRWKLNLGLEVLAYYDDNIFLEATNEQDDFIFAISPWVAVGRGDLEARVENFFIAYYRPTFLLFTDNTDENGIDQDLGTEIQYRSGRLTTSGELRYRRLSGSEIEIGGRAQRDIYYGKLGAEYDLTGKISLSAEQEIILIDYDENRFDSNEFIFRLFANYQATEKLRIGAGIGLGYLDVIDSNTQTYEQLLLRANYVPSPKLFVNLRGGIEFRQYDATGEDRVRPTLALGAEWSPFVNTTFFADVFVRERNSSVLSGQNYLNYGGLVGVRQGLLQKLNLSLSAGYEFFDYNAAVDNVNATREDEYLFLRAALSYSPRDWLDLEVFYQHRNNDSNQGNREWENNQVGVQAAIKF